MLQKHPIASSTLQITFGFLSPWVGWSKLQAVIPNKRFKIFETRNWKGSKCIKNGFGLVRRSLVGPRYHLSPSLHLDNSAHCADNLDNWDNLWIIRSCARRTAPACRAPRCLKHSQAASVCASAGHVCFMIYRRSWPLKFWTWFFYKRLLL